MNQSTRNRVPFKVGDWLVEPGESRLLSAGAGRLVERQAMIVLTALATYPGAEISRSQLKNHLAQHGFHGEDQLAFAIDQLREALNDNQNEARYVAETRHGYQLVAPVERLTIPDPSFLTTGWLRIRRSNPWALVPLVLALAAALTWAFSFLVTSGWESEAAPRYYSEARPVSNQPGRQMYPALSPDGRRLAFTWRVQGRQNWDIYVQDIGSDNMTRITDGEGEESYAAWSRDGRFIAYIREGLYEPAIYQRPADGGLKVLLARCPPTAQHLNWSPDGRFLTYNAEDTGQSGPSRIWIHRIQTREAKAVSTPPESSLGDVEPRFSPDGHWLAFRRKYANYREDLLLVPAQGGRERKVTLGDWGQILGFDWTTDGRGLICSANRDGRFALWRIPLKGGTPERLPYENDWPIWPRTARDNDRLVYKSYAGSLQLNLVTLDTRRQKSKVASTGQANGVESSGQSRFKLSKDGSDRFPQLSPDGSRLAFISNRSGHFEVWSAQLDGTNLRKHTRLAGTPPGPPSWSRDGQWLMFDAHPFGQSDLFRVHIDSDTPERITHDPADERYPRFSNDGQIVYFASNRSGSWQIWRQTLAEMMHMDSSEAIQVTQDGGLIAQEAANGDLYFVKPADPQLWRRPVDGGAPEPVLELGEWDWNAWVVGSSGIYVLRRDPLRLVHIDKKTGFTTTLTQLDDEVPRLEPSFTISEDEGVVVFGQLDHHDDQLIAGDLGRPAARR